MKKQPIKWGSKEFWKRIDRTGNEFSMHQMKWLLGGVANTINNNGEIFKNESANSISTSFTKLDIFDRGGAWKKNKQEASELIKKIRVVKVKDRKGGAPMSKQICEDYVHLDDDLLHILSLNTWKEKNGSNFNQIVEECREDTHKLRDMAEVSQSEYLKYTCGPDSTKLFCARLLQLLA